MKQQLGFYISTNLQPWCRYQTLKVLRLRRDDSSALLDFSISETAQQILSISDPYLFFRFKVIQVRRNVFFVYSLLYQYQRTWILYVKINFIDSKYWRREPMCPKSLEKIKCVEIWLRASDVWSKFRHSRIHIHRLNFLCLSASLNEKHWICPKWEGLCFQTRLSTPYVCSAVLSTQTFPENSASVQSLLRAPGV